MKCVTEKKRSQGPGTEQGCGGGEDAVRTQRRRMVQAEFVGRAG